MQAGGILQKKMSELLPDETGPRDRAPGGDRPPEEQDILQQLRAGDAEAGRAFVRDFYPGVYRYLLLMSGRPELAEDLTQETFLQAWRHLDQFAGRSSLRVWLH